jgi:AraC-like DNA-binding protein
MTVSAQLANNLTSAATAELLEYRADATVRAGTFTFEGQDVVLAWHRHELHQIEYAFAGVVEVETPGHRYLLPPQQAVWIPAGLPHRTRLRRVHAVSVFFAPDMLPGFGERARILAAAPVIREMIIYATKWPITRVEHAPAIDSYFDVLADLVGAWLDHETPLCLPTSTDPVIAAVMAYTDSHLATVTERAVCHAVGVSPRTLRRRFAALVEMSWSQYALEARVLRAMADLAESSDSVTAVALRVGFDNPSSFSRAFRRYAGETPSGYRDRVCRDSPKGQ